MSIASFGEFDAISGIAFLGLSILQVVIPFNINKMGDSKDFIKRYICLSIPLTIIFLIVLVPIQVIINLLLENTEKLDILSALILIIVSIIYIYALNRCFDYVSKGDRENS